MITGRGLIANDDGAVQSTSVARLVIDEAAAKRVAALLAEMLDPDAAAIAVFEDEIAGWVMEASFSPPADETAVRRLVAQIAGEAAARALTFTNVAVRDWVKRSLDALTPVVAGRFVVHGRHDRARIARNQIGIEIEAALAFGTGHHATTRGCLLALDGLVKRQGQRPLRKTAGRAPSGLRVLDIGTGSGVLAIAAAKALRSPVLAGDIDRTAVAAAGDNVRRNGVAPVVTVIHAAGLAAQSIRARMPYRLAFANILLGPLKQLARPLARAMTPGARVVLSGLLAPQANAALSVYGAQGFTLERRITLENWTTLMLVRTRIRPKAKDDCQRAQF